MMKLMTLQQYAKMSKPALIRKITKVEPTQKQQIVQKKKEDDDSKSRKRNSR